MDPHATTFLRNGAAAAASQEWTALLRHFAPTVLEFVAKYNDKPKWQQACLAILGPTFVEQYLPDGVSQQHLLEPPHLLRSEALAIKQQVTTKCVLRHPPPCNNAVAFAPCSVP